MVLLILTYWIGKETIIRVSWKFKDWWCIRIQSLLECDLAFNSTCFGSFGSFRIHFYLERLFLGASSCSRGWSKAHYFRASGFEGEVDDLMATHFCRICHCSITSCFDVFYASKTFHHRSYFRSSERIEWPPRSRWRNLQRIWSFRWPLFPGHWRKVPRFVRKPSRGSSRQHRN